MELRNRRVELLLVDRYKAYFADDTAFRRGLGIGWPNLRKSIIDDAMRSTTAGVGAPLSVAQAAAVLNVTPRELLVLAKHYTAGVQLFAAQGDGIQQVRMRTVSPIRLLEWAEGVPPVCGWRRGRDDSWSLGATASARAIVGQVRIMESTCACVQVESSGDTLEVIALQPGRTVFPMAMEDLLKWQELDAREVKSSGPWQLRSLTLPEALCMPWKSCGLRRVWLERFRSTLTRLDYLLERKRIESRSALARARQDIGHADHARRKLRALIALAR